MMGVTEQPAWAGHVSCSGAGLGALFLCGIQFNPGQPLEQLVSVGSGQRCDSGGGAKAPRKDAIPLVGPLRSPDGPCTNGWLHLHHCLHRIHVSESVSCLGWSSALFTFEAPAPSKEHRLWRRGRHEKRSQNRVWEIPGRREIQKG